MTFDLHHHGDADVDPTDAGQLDLAVNVRRREPPEWLVARLHDGLRNLGSYPRADAATAAVAARHGRPPGEVLVTNGAAEAFTLIARALPFTRAVCIHPSFTGPEAALRDAARDVERVILPEPFGLDPALVPDDADLVVLGNPTNPTGRLHPAAAIAGLARPGRTLVVDEAFADAIPGEPESLAGCTDIPGLVVVRSLTKTWGLAGLRVGYVLAAPDLIATLAAAQPEWPVNSLALDALEACSSPEAVAWADAQARVLAEWRRDFVAALAAVPEVHVVDGGAAPFVLLRVPNGEQQRERLRDQGIVVRRGDTFPGLGPDWVRLAVVAPEQHERIVAGLRSAHAAATAVATEPRRGVARSRGTVTLVGAGPGGADLITLRGWQALHQADVVIADRLADDSLTAELRPGVELIDAGKAPGRHQLKQDEINALIVDRAAAGATVVRLKGGDPYVFGRGNEEVEVCAAAGIECVVVPGLSSVTAAPALAGVPITRRGLSQSFTVVSGHLPPGHERSQIDWERLATSTDTLVLLMAVGQLPEIVDFLLDHGRDSETPSSVIESAGTARQRLTLAPLNKLVAACEEAEIRNPAVIVVGASVAATIPNQPRP
ncbi:MAG TPA: Rv2231c family pyridoxal phosphate-dependent protein CobC [Mycobacteriales bacterium]|nr:Rv2231c family pyridoxal phosphate-dependent protein CobC [Mycobacteriales bacterium]